MPHRTALHMLSASLWLLGACAGASSPRAGAAPPQEPAASAIDPHWTLVEARGVSALVPGALNWKFSIHPNPAGDVRLAIAAVADPDGVLDYRLARFDFPERLARVMDRRDPEGRSWQALLDDRVAEQLRSDDIRIGQWQGRRHNIRLEADVVGEVREVWVGDTLFIAFASGPGPVLAPGAARFLDSFRPLAPWRDLVVEADGFGVQVPLDASHESEIEGEVRLHQFSLAGEPRCWVSVTPLPDPPSAAALAEQVLRDVTAGGGRAKSLGEHRQHGFVGQAFAIANGDGNHERWLMFAYAGSLYLVRGGTAQSGAMSATAEHCLASFRLTVAAVPL